jgi:hypothetical protein
MEENMEIRVNDFFARRERILNGLSTLLQEKIAQEKQRANQVAENHKIEAFECAKLKADFTINSNAYIPDGNFLYQQVTYVHGGNKELLIELPPEAIRNIALKAADKYIGNLLDKKV